MALLFSAAITMTFAQDSPSDKLFEKYNGEEGFTTVHITSELFALFADMDIEGEDMEDMKEMMDQLKHIRILMYELDKENPERGRLEDFKKEIKQFDLDGFSELMTVKEKGEEVKFMARKKGDRIGELLLIINEEDEAGFISIFGDIDLNTVSKLSKTMKFEGMDQLEKLEEGEER
jgi:ribonuclease BN (tRNA processing enzyme)